jgi:hypothetical protein
MSLPFNCPKCKTGWELGSEEIDDISKHQPLVCPECGNSFGLLEGVTDAITTDNVFVQYMLRSNHILLGKSEFVPGVLEFVDLKGKFKEIHRIFLTATGSKPVRCEPVAIGHSGFMIVSSLTQLSSLPKKRQVM